MTINFFTGSKWMQSEPFNGTRAEGKNKIRYYMENSTAFTAINLEDSGLTVAVVKR